MTTTTETSARTVLADAIDKAADHIERVGHHRGHPYDPRKAAGMPREECPVSADAALRIAVYGTYIPPATVTAEQVGLVFAAEQAIQAHVKQRIDQWNDDPKKRKAQIVKGLRDTAAKLRAGETL